MQQQQASWRSPSSQMAGFEQIPQAPGLELSSATQASAESQLDTSLLGKTKYCKYYVKGTCSRGSSCTYAHGSHELRSKPVLYRTGLCLDYVNLGTCSYGEKCRYAHGEDELRPVQMSRAMGTKTRTKTSSSWTNDTSEGPMQSEASSSTATSCASLQHRASHMGGVPSYPPQASLPAQPMSSQSFDVYDSVVSGADWPSPLLPPQRPQQQQQQQLQAPPPPFRYEEPYQSQLSAADWESFKPRNDLPLQPPQSGWRQRDMEPMEWQQQQQQQQQQYQQHSQQQHHQQQQQQQPQVPSLRPSSQGQQLWCNDEVVHSRQQQQQQQQQQQPLQGQMGFPLPSLTTAIASFGLPHLE